MKKRFGKLSLLLVAGMTAVIALSSCSGGDKESGKIRVFFGDTKGTDNDEVSKAVSDYSKKKIGVEVEMVFFGAGEYDKKMPKLMATNEQMDIGFTSGDDFVTYARSGAFYDIKKDLDDYPALKELFGDEFLKGVTIDGGIYGIPTLKEMAEVWAIYIDAATLKNCNMTADSIKSLADAEPILAKLKSEGRQGFNADNTGTHVNFAMKKAYDPVTGYFVISNDDSIKAEDKEIVNFVDTKEFEDFVNLMHSWYQKGYINADVLENGTTTYYNVTGDDKTKAGMTYVSYAPLNEVGATKGSGLGEMTPMLLTEPTVSNGSTRGSIYAIYKKSENKQSALKFLQLWNTDKKANTLIKFGIEGKHYNFITEDGAKKVKKVDGANTMYLNQNWRSGNVLLAYVEEGEDAKKPELYDEFNKNARTSCVLGFTPDLTEFESELANCNAVITTKVNAIATGAIDPADPQNGIEAIRRDMKKAGSDKLITELQKQYYDWLDEK